MNKVILSLLLAVCILGMALIMLNERLRKPEPATAPAGIIAPVTPPTAAEGTPPAEPAGDALRMPPQGQGKLPDLNANGESPARAPLPSLKPEEKSAPASNALASSAPSSPQPAVAKPAVPAKPAAPMTEKPAPTAAHSTPKAEKPAAEHKSVTKFVVFTRDKGVTVRIKGAAPLIYKNMTLSSPERLVIDLDGKWQIKAPGVPKNSLIKNVRIGKADDKTRIVIDLSGKAKSRFTISKDQRTLDVHLDH